MLPHTLPMDCVLMLLEVESLEGDLSVPFLLLNLEIKLGIILGYVHRSPNSEEELAQ